MRKWLFRQPNDQADRIEPSATQLQDKHDEAAEKQRQSEDTTTSGQEDAAEIVAVFAITSEGSAVVCMTADESGRLITTPPLGQVDTTQEGKVVKADIERIMADIFKTTPAYYHFVGKLSNVHNEKSPTSWAILEMEIPMSRIKSLSAEGITTVSIQAAPGMVDPCYSDWLPAARLKREEILKKRAETHSQLYSS